ncbi:MAG TPA: dTMP kinase [Spirochaetota bacterium]|nr:dTMP kinase [Spirochaetota bacterium]
MPLTLPLFIVFEGIDGSGKTTLAERIHARYASLLPAVLLAEPTTGARGAEIRALLKRRPPAPVSRLLELFILDREEDVRRNIVPALAAGKLVVMDRYYISNAAYQGTGDIAPADIVAMNRERGFQAPHRVYLVDLDPAEALGRVEKRNPDRDIFENRRFLEKVRENYRVLADDTFLVLDGRLDPGSLERAVADDLERSFKAR